VRCRYRPQKIGATHPAAHVPIGILPRFAASITAASCLRDRLRSRRPVCARALQCGLRSSQSLLTAPSLRLVATTRLRTTSLAEPRFVSFFAGRHRAAGLVHAAGIRPAVPSASALYPSAAASCRKTATHFVCVALAPVRGHPAWRASGPIVATTSCRRRSRFATVRLLPILFDLTLPDHGWHPPVLRSRLSIDFNR
jgi:hypothetical protein